MATHTPPLSDDFARGLAGVVAGRTAICSLEGDLRYRGYAIEPLARAGDFEEVAFLLLHGELPTRTEREAFAARVSDAARTLDPAVIDALARLAAACPSASPMDALRTAVSVLGQIERDVLPGPRDALLAQAERLLGQVPAVLAAWCDLAAGRPVSPWPDGPIASALLHRLTGRTPLAEHAAVFGTTLVLYAEHEFNASTFTARTIVSTGSDMHSGITGAIGALKGPLHGGANEQVLEVLAAIGSADRAEAWLEEQFAVKRVVMGFGHRVYKDGDVRAKLLGAMCREMTRGDAAAEKIEQLADRVESLMLARKKLKPNLDWPAARVYHALGLPVAVFTPIFVVARMSGWTAHIIEQIGDNRLIRPLSLYSGPAPRDYVPLESR
ncbi:MAG: citrate synthase [Planctomycetia bacterium]|nr:citrate synthase [Planctomycetia bacterium]